MKTNPEIQAKVWTQELKEFRKSEMKVYRQDEPSKASLLGLHKVLKSLLVRANALKKEIEKAYKKSPSRGLKAWSNKFSIHLEILGFEEKLSRKPLTPKKAREILGQLQKK